ncbi:acyltransferase [uncultured Phocaeicola sp.]|uniref:acyltransferase n=1 Tax=uncultured Phocaeicola sp. TaxID=990718 RepID=UPI0025A0A302|nr:acyltransferase [uncultured Phocaeicola sp.]
MIAGGRVFIKKWTSLSFNCTIVTGNHKPTVGLNQRIIERLHINDIEKDVVIGEDCWVGANVTILSGTMLGRGSVVGACSLLNKSSPPYAVLVGTPAKIVGVKFSLEQILKHESNLYPEHERMSRDELEVLFEKYYKGLKSMGTDYLSPEEKMKSMQYANMQYKI